MKTWLQLKDVNLSLEASNSQYNLTYFFLILHLLVVLALEKKKESHAVIVPLTGNRYFRKIIFE